MTNWADLEGELDRWAAGGRRADLWWRDDDAAAPGPRLRRLTDLSRRSGAPLALAVIPGLAVDALADDLAELPGVSILVHGLRHENRAPPGQKKAEFGAYRPLEELAADAASAWRKLHRRFPTLARPVFVPPWNRIAAELPARLPQAGLRGLSRFGPRAAARPAPGLLENNCHLDLIDWRGGRGFIGQELALAQLTGHLRQRRTGAVDGGECSGVLSHHDVMDQPGWDFLAELFARTKKRDGAHWLTMNEVFRVPR